MSALDAWHLIIDETHEMNACPLVESVARLLRGRADELTEQRVRTRGAALELGMRLRGALVEMVELRRDLHPWFVATQAHPEFKSRPTRPHPLFREFVRAAAE